MNQSRVFSSQVPALLESHFQHLHEASGINLEAILERGYRSVLGNTELRNLGFTKGQCRTPGILIPIWGVDGQKIGDVYRPDNPRSDSRGRVIKYDNIKGSSLRLDCPPRCKDKLGDPSVALWITEGVKKEDALASQGLCVVGLSGVWGFKGKNRLGGITFLADWDQIGLNDRDVYIVFDSDVMTKPEVAQAMLRLSEHLARRMASVYQVALPSFAGAKVGVDDFLLQHPVNELVALAKRVSTLDALTTERETKIEALVDDAISGRTEPKGAIDKLREVVGHRHKIRSAISYIVINILRANGFFVHAAEGRYYFYGPMKELLSLDGFAFGAFLNTLFGLNQSEPEFTYVLADANTEAHAKGRRATVHQVAFYDKERHLLYLDRFDGSVYRLDGEKIELVDNGADGVLFCRQPSWKPYTYLGAAPQGGLLSQVLVDDIAFQTGSFAPLTPNQQRMVFTLWIFSLFFESLLPAKPILTIIGEKGSGLTTSLRRVLRFLFGPDADVTGLEREREDAFVAAVTHGYVIVFDNLDGKMTWVNDRLAVAASSSLIQRRRLYTTNEVAIYRPRCFLAVTSRDPQFKRDDVVDRLVLLKVDRLSDFLPENELLDRVDSSRDLLWTELLTDLNDVVASLRHASGKPKARLRMSDWATLCWRIAELQGVGDEFDNILYPGFPISTLDKAVPSPPYRLRR